MASTRKPAASDGQALAPPITLMVMKNVDGQAKILGKVIVVNENKVRTIRNAIEDINIDAGYIWLENVRRLGYGPETTLNDEAWVKLKQSIGLLWKPTTKKKSFTDWQNQMKEYYSPNNFEPNFDWHQMYRNFDRQENPLAILIDFGDNEVVSI